MKDNYKDKVFADRAVDPAVARERGYREYLAGGALVTEPDKTVLDVDRRLNERKVWFREAMEAPGWVIPKFAVMPHSPEEEFRMRPHAQLRPEWPVKRRFRGHDHDGMRHRPHDDEVLQRRKGSDRGRCYCGLVHKEAPIQRGVAPGSLKRRAGETFWELQARYKEKTPDWYEPAIKDRGAHEASTCDFVRLPTEEEEWRFGVRDWKNGGELIRDEKGKVLVRTGHLHPHTGEPVFGLDRKTGKIGGPHAHLKWAKYLYVKGRGKAQRLGTHPRMLRDNFAAPERLFFFVIEGTLKLDAVVSAGWPGIESGSVTLWNSQFWDETAEDPAGVNPAYVRHVQELREFARLHLQGVPTAVVCDSDWSDNLMVLEQVRLATGILNECGVPAIGCAPPPGRDLGWNDPNTGHRQFAKNGVDDYLAGLKPRERHDGLLNLIVREEAVDDAPGLEDEVSRHHTNAQENIRLFLRDASRRAADNGVFALRTGKIAAAMGCDETTVRRIRRNLEGTQALLEIAEHRPRVQPDGKTRSDPALEVLRHDLRAPARRRTLGEWLATVG